MTHKDLCFLLFIPVVLARAREVRADEHIVRQGESLPELAEQFYGDARRAPILALANGIAAVDATLTPGERLVVPAPEYRVVSADDSWETLASRLLGDERRAFILVLANHATAEVRPAAGSEIVVPPIVTDRNEVGESLSQIAEHFYGDREVARMIKRFNFMNNTRVDRGGVGLVLMPFPELRLTAAGRAALEGDRVARSDGTRTVAQGRAEGPIRELEHLLRIGAYVEVVTAGSRLMADEGSLSGNQIVSIERAMGIAHVALDRPDLAITSFRIVLAHQPDLDWNPITTSPKVLRIWRIAREEAVAPP